MKLLLLFSISLFGNSAPCKLPREIEKIRSEQYLDSRVVNNSAITESWDMYLETDCPALAKGDFNGDGKDDYAFISSKKGPDPFVLIIAQSNEDSFDLIEVMDIGFGIYEESLGFGIQMYPKGEVRGANNTVSMKNDGLQFSLFEFSTAVFYLEDGTYHYIWIDN